MQKNISALTSLDLAINVYGCANLCSQNSSDGKQSLEGFIISDFFNVLY
jgi:hypothetical protein